MPARYTVLFICSGNSCRSQMAEGWARHLHGGVIDAWSAGTNPRGVDLRTIRVMAEAGVDIARHRSKHVGELWNLSFNLVITVCDDARESCPVFPSGTRAMHIRFDDPRRLAEEARTEEEALAAYRRVRDEIREFVERLPDVLAGASKERSIR